jgi:hypothetical protein
VEATGSVYFTCGPGAVEFVIVSCCLCTLFSEADASVLCVGRSPTITQQNPNHMSL